MQTEIKTAKISEIKLNPDNPRTISNKDMELLIKSLKEFPEMLNLREIVVDENMVVLGGNMRLLALQKMGASDCQIRVVNGLTPEQKREFVIKDNSNFGRYDFDTLANEWSDLPLADWGVDLPEGWTGDLLDLTLGDGKNNQTTYDKLADKKGGILFSFGDIQQSIPSEVYESFYAKINMSNVKDSLIEELSK